ncbi:polysaccharide pyruvyl transferase family protein [Demequina sp. SYSU T00192]|uniref:Polysaccharide pyruvyl transferase family protein n=1 Tax=Demequina litoralis TaxID=3051660 RepID=A0ABT8G8D6_9MICO|nr:polysaccharide pyruvyl transferase family protein [Demequina sp. SYSU T00192]MDN4475410.1 polysaccharide pyruvyl transferase family protein [Demequina sp. SYSU T00192]
MTDRSAPRAARRARTAVFASVNAQTDNLGDILIRREMLAWIGDLAIDLRIFVGAMPESYLEACRIPAGARLYRSSVDFQRDLLREALRSRVFLFFAPGPYFAPPTLSGVGKSFVNLANATVARMSSGGAVVLGRAYRDLNRPHRLLNRALVTHARFACLRDLASSEALGADVRFEPDLGFGEADRAGGDAAGTRRRYVAFSLRSGKDEPRGMLEAARDWCAETGLELAFVTQVGRDDERHARLSRELGGVHVGWDGAGHAAQLDEVARVYRESALIVSDRLHAVVLGSTCGATPIALKDADWDKLPATLQPVMDLTLLARDADASTARETLAKARPVRADIEAAHARLHGARAELRALLDPTAAEVAAAEAASP